MSLHHFTFMPELSCLSLKLVPSATRIVADVKIPLQVTSLPLAGTVQSHLYKFLLISCPFNNIDEDNIKPAIPQAAIAKTV